MRLKWSQGRNHPCHYLQRWGCWKPRACVRVTPTARGVAGEAASDQLTGKSRAVPLGKTLSNYYLWSCAAVGIKRRAAFPCLTRAMGARSWASQAAVRPAMCAVERETSGKGYRLEATVTLQLRNAVFLSDSLGLFWLFSSLINSVIGIVMAALIKCVTETSRVCWRIGVSLSGVVRCAPPSLRTPVEMQVLMPLQLSSLKLLLCSCFLGGGGCVFVF